MLDWLRNQCLAEGYISDLDIDNLYVTDDIDAAIEAVLTHTDGQVLSGFDREGGDAQ